MRQIRRGVFETNSSSTHSLTICTEDQFNDWKDGKLLYDAYSECFCSIDELTEYEKEEAIENYNDEIEGNIFYKKWEELSEDEQKIWFLNQYAIIKQRDLLSYEDFFTRGCLERYQTNFTTPSGDKMIAFGKYGYT